MRSGGFGNGGFPQCRDSYGLHLAGIVADSREGAGIAIGERTAAGL